MPFHDKAFWAMVFFLVGVLAASGVASLRNAPLVIVIVMFLLAGSLFFIGRQELAIISLFFICGAGYYAFDDARYHAGVITIAEHNSFRGIVERTTLGLEKQDLVVRLAAPQGGRVKITTARYPEWQYGDEITFDGKSEPPSGNSAGYLSKERIGGLMSFPPIKLLAHNKGNTFKAVLLNIKSSVETSYRRTLSPMHAAFLSGLILGDTAEFSKEFRQKMSATGTSHLVALSGYNVTIIAKSVLAALGVFFSRRKAIWVAAAAIFAFVVMTGAEASVVRAAIMALIIIIAEHSGRLYSVRNAVAVAAFIMVIVNPKVLRWDIGFQLSFLALLGLVYLRPVVAKVFRFASGPGFLGWRENFLSTLSAQLAVLPILILSFGSFSPISLLTNLLILSAVPATMFLGAALASASIVSYLFAGAIGLIVSVFLAYEIGVIDLFSRFSAGIPLSVPGTPFAIVYYAFLGVLIWKMRKKLIYVQN